MKRRHIQQTFLTLALLMAVACTPSGHLRPDVADGTLTTIALSCKVAEAWCNPAAPVLPAEVCRWLIPGCLGVHGMATLLLPAATPPLVPDAKLSFMAADLSPPMPVAPFEMWEEACRQEPVEGCEEAGGANRDGRDVVVVMRR